VDKPKKVKYYVVKKGAITVKLEETGEIHIEFAGCQECGTCKIACPHGALEWHYPRGEYGVQYRYG
jgi:ferredoxin-like protein FixX